ncbi:hypothetical protein TNCV_5086001 [Trichonephila clavipes]|uniref:Uncharacterized protein n=1 Tax=Trichonephila clavipes TaxID=2585209 RepID=A0A8X6VIN4_TRICX|nr:hypothetical protein TNCV_5086001 [Trichonephila clavipes]
MFDSSPYVNPTPLAHADTSRDVLPRGVTEKGQCIEFHPIGNVAHAGLVQFLISRSDEDYLDLSQTQLYVKAKIVKSNGKALTANDKVVYLC